MQRNGLLDNSIYAVPQENNCNSDAIIYANNIGFNTWNRKTVARNLSYQHVYLAADGDPFISIDNLASEPFISLLSKWIGIFPRNGDVAIKHSVDTAKIIEEAIHELNDIPQFTSMPISGSKI